MNLTDIQASVHEWQEREFRPLSPRNALADGLVLCEEAGEVARCLVKREQKIRGTAEHWTEELAKEMCDVVITVIALAGNEGIDLESALIARWNEVGARKFATEETA